MKGQIYKHLKTGGEYIVLTEATREADQVPVVVYQNVNLGNVWVRPRGEFLDGRFEHIGERKSNPDIIADIEEFHHRFELTYDGPPRTLTGELGDFREGFMQEEHTEYCQNREAALQEIDEFEVDKANYTYHLEQQLDALVDLVYVAVGTGYLQGFNFAEAWRRVHRANMNKVRAASADDSKRGTTFDVVKPEGWEPPSHTDLVEVNDAG